MFFSLLNLPDKLFSPILAASHIKQQTELYFSDIVVEAPLKGGL